MNIPYDLKNPTKTYKLPKKYMEISGICPLQDNDSLAFVQDEAIRVYQFDLTSTEITAYAKHGPGDSEDIVILGNTAYILHAGKRPAIYKITGYNSGSSQCERYDLNLDKDYDPEGLCHDAEESHLLIACKGSPVKGDKLRKIFSFDIQSMTRAYSPVFTIDSREFLDKTDEALRSLYKITGLVDNDPGFSETITLLQYIKGPDRSGASAFVSFTFAISGGLIRRILGWGFPCIPLYSFYKLGKYLSIRKRCKKNSGPKTAI